MDTKKPTDTAATVIIGQTVRAGSEQAFEEWQKDLNREASKYPGFLAAEINPPTAVQPEWIVVYRFDSIAHVQAWINSATRQERLAAGQEFFDGPGTQQVLGGGARHTDPLVTVAVSHHVPPENVDVMAEVRKASPVPIATGERRVTRYEFREIFEKQACHVIQPDLCTAAGSGKRRRSRPWRRCIRWAWRRTIRWGRSPMR